jgi:Piwi domain
MRYRGLERTFGVSFGQPVFLLADRCEEYIARLREFTARSQGKSRPFFLVYAPERSYSRADYEGPYYQVKHFLLEHGYPSQMVDEDTIADPKMKELNLALDIFAKSGYVPWVLAEGLPSADLFIGLSCSSVRIAGRVHRIVAYVNVFDRYGRWQYYRSGTAPINFEHRTEQFRALVRQVVSDYHAHSNLQPLHIHHGAQLKRRDREEIAAGILEVVPEAEISFVRINQHTLVRWYDSRADGDGSLKRAMYVATSPNQFYISTTGFNDLGQKALGTPRALEVTVHTMNFRGDLDLRQYAQHILSLTKLNWASSRTFCRDPITLKFASDIAYLMNVFLAPFGGLRLHPDLERTAWFL